MNYTIGFVLKELKINKNINISKDLYNQINDLLILLNDKDIIKNFKNNNNLNEININFLINFDEYDKDFSVYSELSSRFLKKMDEHRLFTCNKFKCIKDFICGQDDEEVDYIKDCKDESINNISKLLSIVEKLKEKTNNELSNEAENLFSKFNKALETIGNSKRPEVNLELTIDYAKDFLLEARIINLEDIDVLKNKIDDRNKNCV